VNKKLKKNGKHLLVTKFLTKKMEYPIAHICPMMKNIYSLQKDIMVLKKGWTGVTKGEVY